MRLSVITTHLSQMMHMNKNLPNMLSLPIRDLRGPEELRAWESIQTKHVKYANVRYIGSTTDVSPPKQNRLRDHLLTLKKVAIGGRHE